MASSHLDRPIFALASKCDNLLRECHDLLEQKFPLLEESLKDYTQRFTAWWEYTGVFSAEEISLDSRLHNHPKVQDIVIRLLLLLGQNLAQLKRHQNHLLVDIPYRVNSSEAPMPSPPKAQTNHDDSLHLVMCCLDAIDDSLRELGRVGIAIRRSRKRETARARKWVSEHANLDYFRTLTFLAVETLYPNAPTTLVTQLACSMVDRYARLCVRDARRNALKEDIRRRASLSLLSSKQNQVIERRGIKNEIYQTNQLTEQGERPNMYIPQPGTVSSLNTDLFNKAYETSQKPRLKAVTTVALNKENEPPIPRFDDEEETTCQWCFAKISHNLVDNGHWSNMGREHYCTDLEPFICISESCSESIPSFSSSRDWGKHMQDHSPKWIQDVHRQTMWKCNLGEIHEEGSEILFSTPEHFLAHVRALHPDNLANNDDSTTTETSSVKRPISANICPLCYFPLQNANQAVSLPTKQMESHIKSHLRKLLVLSLRLMEIQDEQSNESSFASNKSYGSGSEKSIGVYSDESMKIDAREPLIFGSPTHRSIMEDDDIPDIDPKGLPEAWRAILRDDQPVHAGKAISINESELDEQSVHASEGHQSKESQQTIPHSTSPHIKDEDIPNIQYDDSVKAETRFITSGSQPDHSSAHITYRDRGNEFWRMTRRHRAATITPNLQDIDTHTSLFTAIREGRIRTTNKDSYFIPLDTLELAKDRNLVEHALQEDGVSQEEILTWVQRICTSQPEESEYFRIFSILVLCENPKSIGKFIDKHIDDSYLPLPNMERKGNRITISRDNHGGKISEEILNYFFHDKTEWKQGALDNFVTYQWWVIAPFFYRPDNIIPHYVLEPSDVLPFTEKKSNHEVEMESADPDIKELVLQGGFSDVFIVKIHPSHYHFRNQPFSDNSHSFAMKRLRSLNPMNFQLEVHALSKYDCGIDNHLIPLLATIEKESEAGKYYLLFPKANGDLRYFWKTEFSKSHGNPSIIRWMTEQCLGIARAISMLHQDQDTDKGEDHPIYGRHGDIKAGNILWFSKPNTPGPSGWCLVLSDFGLTSFHRGRSISAQTASELKKTLTYQAPEFDIKGATISRKSDIWALGCTYLEFITCYLSGFEAVEEEFPSRRGEEDQNLPGVSEDKFYRMTANGTSAELKPGVKDWICDLRSNPRCSQYFQDFLDLIERGMLCIERDERFTAAKVAANLEVIFKKCARKSYTIDKHVPQAKDDNEGVLQCP